MKKSKEPSDKYGDRADRIKKIIKKKLSKRAAREPSPSPEPEPVMRKLPPPPRKSRFDFEMERALQESLMFAESAKMA